MLTNFPVLGLTSCMFVYICSVSQWSLCLNGLRHPVVRDTLVHKGREKQFTHGKKERIMLEKILML